MQFNMCTWEIINDALKNDEQASFLYMLGKKQINNNNKNKFVKN